MEPCSLAYVPDHFKTQEMCNMAVRMEPLLLKYVADHLKTQEMCLKKGYEGFIMLLITLRPKGCVKKQLSSTHSR